MTQENAKKWLPELIHFANGGTLWGYSSNHQWFKYKNPLVNINFKDEIIIIEDKHFEARKAFALGDPIEWSDKYTPWTITENPTWKRIQYRAKPDLWKYSIPEEGILCWINEEHTIAKIITGYCGVHTNHVSSFYVANDGDERNHNSTHNYAQPIKPNECWSEKTEKH